MMNTRRISWGVTRLLVVAILAGAACQEDPEIFGPDPEPPDDPTMTESAQRILIGPGGKVLGRQYLLWDPTTGWRALDRLSPEPGVSEASLAVGVSQFPAPANGLGLQGVSANLESTQAFIAGGFGRNGSAAGSQAYHYDGPTDTWTAFQMSHPRVDHTLTSFSEGRVLIVGGNDATPEPQASAEVFDARTMQLGPTGSMAEARWGHAASRLADGRVLVTGGQNASGQVVGVAEIYDPLTGEFTPSGSLTTPRAAHSQITLDDGRVLVLGGAGLASAELWDPATGEFTATQAMDTRHGAGHSATKLMDGRVLVLGGDGSVGRLEPTDVAEIYDPATDQFSPAGTMTSPRWKHFAVLHSNGTVLIGGGVDDSGFPVATVELYDPNVGSFTPLADMPVVAAAPPAVFLAGSS